MADDRHTNDTWHVVTEKNKATFAATTGSGVTDEYALDLAHVAHVNLTETGALDEQTSVDMVATAKWDGCVHLHVGALLNGDANDRDYVHICDIDDFIRQLERVRDAARKHFGDNGYWKGGPTPYDSKG